MGDHTGNCVFFGFETDLQIGFKDSTKGYHPQVSQDSSVYSEVCAVAIFSNAV